MPLPPLKSLKNKDDRAASTTCTLSLLSLSPPSPTTRHLSSLTSLSLSSPSLHPFPFLPCRPQFVAQRWAAAAARRRGAKQRPAAVEQWTPQVAKAAAGSADATKRVARGGRSAAGSCGTRGGHGKASGPWQACRPTACTDTACGEHCGRRRARTRHGAATSARRAGCSSELSELLSPFQFFYSTCRAGRAVTRPYTRDLQEQKLGMDFALVSTNMIKIAQKLFL
ncbi:hypothetical protein PVAP13_9KG037578 [Panicum virgatum]|uniref:Uncharacterized protein n=1 Tax=Panicum virgatum TaxID=38727 RepID=A0A8T0NB68_PANVG|nr:hypothetical protein PVAP13_9KG037578 [Panicum virgatum]